MGAVGADLFVVAAGANDMNTELYICCLGNKYILSLNYFFSCGLIQDAGICCSVVGP